MQPKGLPYDSIVMRELGQSFADRGFFEVNLASGSMEWANNFVLEKYGMTLEQIQAIIENDVRLQLADHPLRQSPIRQPGLLRRPPVRARCWRASGRRSP